MPHKRELTACSLWIAALVFMFFGTLTTTEQGHPSPALAWALFMAIIALVPTVWCLMERMKPELDDGEVERIIGVVEALHGERGDLHSA